VTIPLAARRAALFSSDDLLPLPDGHPSRRAIVAGITVELPAGLPMGDVFPRVLEEAEVPRAVSAVREFLRLEGRQTGVWFVPEAASPGDLTERLRRLGMRPDDEPPGEPRAAALVAVRPPTAGPTNLVVRPPETYEEFLAGEQVATAAFQMADEMRHAFEERAEQVWPFLTAGGAVAAFIATLDGEIIASAGAHFGRAAVHLTGAATRPDRRGLGAYTALVRARWDAAVSRGSPVLTVSAGAMSRPILERLGFSIVGWINCLVDDHLAREPDQAQHEGSVPERVRCKLPVNDGSTPLVSARLHRDHLPFI
jgi:GNAT superfamily N-acetyltransferase